MDIKMPKLGESVHEGTIEQWLISVGDYVDEYEPLCEVITDKVTAEVPSTVSGTITEILVSEGETVQIDVLFVKLKLLKQIILPTLKIPILKPLRIQQI